ncbi:hypothetical protein IJ670_03905 [bacterium]|nr:hypothetical protein [bacterium]
MGLLVSIFRLAQIRNYRSDLEYQIQLVHSTKLDLSSQINSLVGLRTNLEPDSKEAKELEKKKERLMQAEKALDQQLERYQTQLDMINQEEQQVRQQKQEAIQRTFAA